MHPPMQIPNPVCVSGLGDSATLLGSGILQSPASWNGIDLFPVGGLIEYSDLPLIDRFILGMDQPVSGAVQQGSMKRVDRYGVPAFTAARKPHLVLVRHSH
jgi:hypothetical protein